MNRSVLMAIATLVVFASGAVAVAADEPNQTASANVNPDHAFAMRFRLDRDARAACGVDSNQSRMAMRIWQRQHECLRDYFNGTLR
ncbi:MAG: hypothetical protein WAU68_11835 [Vitreimonas sp.]